MPSKPVDKDTRKAIVDILSIFLNDFNMGDGPLGKLLIKVYEKYLLHPLGADSFSAILGKCSDIKMRDDNLYLLLEPTTDKKILPLVTLHSSDKWVHFRVYTLLTMLDEGSRMQALSLRFETGEGNPQCPGEGSHNFCHAQLCNVLNGPIRASTPTWLPDSQPSIPVDADDQISLVLCMLTSLYGGAHVRRKINDSGGSRNIRKHLDCLRALRGRTSNT